MYVALEALKSFRGPWDLSNSNLDDYVSPESPAFSMNSETLFHHEIVIGLKSFQNEEGDLDAEKGLGSTNVSAGLKKSWGINGALKSWDIYG